MFFEKIYQLKVSLKGSKPIIWRRLLTRSNTLLSDLHLIFQTTMGWTNSHLHQFMINRIIFAESNPENEFYCVDYTKVGISHILKTEKDKMIYEYDFGDGWIHEIMLEKILDKDLNKNIPICIDGKNACPPEDCGGIGGYYNLLEIIGNPEHEEYTDMIEWLEGEFDPSEFDKTIINELLNTKNYGVITVDDLY